MLLMMQVSTKELIVVGALALGAMGLLAVCGVTVAMLVSRQRKEESR